ncbi:MAG: NAD-dependent malic enzyme [Cephaloticoccus sp.]|nr:NAD-dependent malic enzyme [Cephaloticoccus sp.]MCF7759120.1 NAD-dependent malic enzyme [Cephaloticoccus sp.]
MQAKPHLHGKRGADLLHDPLLNKGTAFTATERDTLGLRGLLPPRIITQDQQALRVLETVRNKNTDLERYIYLISLQERNENLFYRVVMDNVAEMMPLIYTPTVGLACQRYALIFRRPRGLFISLHDRGHIKQILQNWPHADVRMIVVTDGERILGLGDLGANGMGIPVGKLSLYTACAGVAPDFCLPVMLDAGTNNQELLEGPHYLGLLQKRERGPAYDELVDEFVQAVQEIFPRACIQFEDFGNSNAFRLLHKYRDQVCTFNDDIQGTAGVALAGILSALRLTGGKMSEQRILFLGAGEAGIGIGELVVTALQAHGVDEAAARRQCWFVDSKGLVVADRTDLSSHKLPFAHQHAGAATLLAAVETIKPTMLIGVSGMTGAFDEKIVRTMGQLNQRPVIFALSNPTSKAECTAEQAYTWTEGRAVFASGSPFPDFTMDGRVFKPGQGNNSYIFPGVGLGLIVSGAQRVTDEMFFVAAKVLAGIVTEQDLAVGRVYPDLQRIREVSSAIARAVAEVAFERGLTSMLRPENLDERVQALMYDPAYVEYV